ncbi:MAG: hypothetical protein RIQ93_3077, partial [Verrucomicrobiota bacterium]
SWKAVVGRAKITPEGPVWMAGYGARTVEGESALHDLWVKALALEDSQGRKAVIVTADNCGAPKAVAERLAAALRQSHGLAREAVLLNFSHTHSGAVIDGLTLPMWDFTPPQLERILAYNRRFEAQLLAAADAALRDLKPATLSWGKSMATFAANRRNNKEADVPKLRAEGRVVGPVDHEVPLVAVHDGNRRLKAALFGYACHTTTLSLNQFSGDYAGFAQLEIERRYPGVTALFTAGCGGNVNPLPRRTVELATDYGRQLADAVDRALATPMTPLTGGLRCAFDYPTLQFASIPTRSQLEAGVAHKDKYEVQRSQFLLGKLARGETIPTSYDYPVQCWRLGDLKLIALGGEPMVEYGLRLKSDLGANTMVLGYSNDVLAYIPNERVLREGGYEGDTAMRLWGHPSPWATGIEEKIVASALKLARR